MLNIQLRPPYLLFLGDEHRPSYAKTAQGIVDWRRELCAGQLRLDAQALDLGLPDMTPADAAAQGVRSLLVGTASIGGAIPASWLEPLCSAARAGLDVVAGLHTRLDSIEMLREAAADGGARLVDVRTAPQGIPVGSGKKRSGLRLLTVGTDCALGKKYTALCLERDMRAGGLAAEFRASGQTGIMLAGSGIPIDSIVTDFVSGAAEQLSPANDPEHWDVIEGQGALFHPGYGAVSLGLLVGSQPDAFVVCHEAGRTHISGWDDFPLPSIGEVIQRTGDIARLTNPSNCCVGIAVNTQALAEGEFAGYLRDLEDRYQLPCVDPMRQGTSAIVDNLVTTITDTSTP